MMTRDWTGSVLVSVLLLCCVGGAQAAGGWLRDGDRWLMPGDGITQNETCRDLLESVFVHCNAGADLKLLGDTESAASNPPTVVGLMPGMADAVDGAWRSGQDPAPHLLSYREALTATVRTYKEQGVAVVLMTPLLTDEAASGGLYDLQGTRAFLGECGRIVREVAEAEGVACVPVAEEFEAYQDTLATEQRLRPDGVQPSALGQYQIARTLWQHLGLTVSTSAQERVLGEAPERVPVSVGLASRFVSEETPALVFQLSAEQPVEVTVTWSFGGVRKTETLQVPPAPGLAWTPELPSNSLDLAAGDAARLVLDLSAGSGRSLYVVDLSCVPVLHASGREFSDVVRSASDGAAGMPVASWRAQLAGKGLLLSGEVVDSRIRASGFWPWDRDGVSVWLDLRPPDRFADIGLDRDVHLAIVNVRTRPETFFSLVPWFGQGMQHAAEVGGETTRTGYRWRLYLHHAFAKSRPADFTQTDLIGLNVIVADNGVRHPAFVARHANDTFGNAMMILDMKDRIQGESIVNVHLWGR